jgi:nucleoside-diphosphate-sugar epimerase
MAPAIPKGSTVLVTGVNGYIGSHVADQLLLAGYRVRGTTREASKAAKLLDIWEKKCERAEELLKSDFGRSGWTNLEESLKMNIEDL